MARVTTEDCIDKIPNKFELSILAGRRAQKIAAGSPTLVKKGRDKYPVTALREIAAGALNIDALREDLINSFRIWAPVASFEEEMEMEEEGEVDFMAEMESYVVAEEELIDYDHNMTLEESADKEEE